MRVANKINRPNASPENILYELMLYTEWIQESDTVRSLYKSGEKGSLFYRALRPWDYFKKCDSLLDEVGNLQNNLLGWHFAIGDVGSMLAILQDTLLEIRTPRDDFSSVVGKATVARDSCQQWRKLCWSPDCSMLALGSSNGAVNFYDLFGSNLFNIPAAGNTKDSQIWTPERSLAGMFFISARKKNQKWPFELILVDYGGNLRSYYISPSEGFMEFHSFSFSKSGVSAVCWDTVHNLLVVSSSPEYNYVDLKSEPLGWGVSAWRLLNDPPFYRRAVPSLEDIARVEARKGIISWVSSFYTSAAFSVVFKMALSPDGQHLACLHTCGTVSVWLMPSLRLHGLWSLKQQPDYNIQPDNVRSRTAANQLEDFYPVDISWWAEQKVIIARKNGAVSVCELNELRNMLGETPEFVHGEPRLSSVCTQKGILLLECEVDHSKDSNNSSEEEESLVNKSSALVKTTVYIITDMERFQPKRKKTKLQRRTFRLLGIKSTTPEELFSRKIDAGEFEEALHLAEVYNLDCDRVYQSQWRNSPVSEEAISAYLSKISKKRWVFEECYERVPDTLAGANKLIGFGLRITSLEALADLAPDGSRQGNTETKEVHQLLVNGKELSLLPVDELSEDQKCLIVTRRTLLRFSDRLYTYEKVINFSEAKYDREVYDKFRRQPLVLSAIDLARKSDTRALGFLLTYQGQETLPYWLTILSNFPETTNPAAYKDLLPECSADGEIFPWEQFKIREEDWCENACFDVLEPEEDMSEYKVPERDEPLSVEVVEEWYRSRVYQLELYSNMVDQPLELVKLACERNIKGLDSLLSELTTLDMLVYDVGMDNISLRDLEVLSPLQKAHALMSGSNEDTFVENLRHKLVPFLQRCERLQSLSRSQLLTEFLSDISSSHGLSLPLKMIEYCTTEPHNLIVPNTEELIVLTLATIYAYQDTDQLAVVDSILRILPTSSLGTSAAELRDRVESAQNELRVAVILKGRGHPLSLLHIHNHRADVDTARGLFRDLATATGNRVPAATQADWNQLIQDLLQMQNLVFTCLPLHLCYEVYTAALLASGSSVLVRTAVRSLCCHSEEKERKPLSLQCSVELVLQAATHYFDSAASLTDSNIWLAKLCLNLITEDNPDIQEEKDLIAALQLLNEFKISLLPLQVRLCTERMRLIESCLMSRPTAYKDHHKLLSLAHKLRICGNDSRQREGTILVRVANIAFEAKDYRHCAEICQQLMERRHSVGWEIAQQLGQCGEFWDLSVRQRLIAFALVHCPDDKVQELVDSRCELEYKRLQTFIHELTGTAETPSEDEEFLDAVTTPQSPTKEFLPQLSSTLQNTSKLVTQLTNSGFWKEKLLYKDTNKDAESSRRVDPSMSMQGFPEFYHSLHDRCHKSMLSADYSGEATVEWKQYQLMQAILQASLLQQEKLPRHLIRDIDNVLVQFATLVLPEDSCVGLATLLALSKPEASDQCFSCLPLTLVTLQLAVYFLALSQALRHEPQAFLWTPNQVLSWAMTHTDNMTEGSWLTAGTLGKAIAQLQNLEQSKRVEQLNCGVNVRRFAWDQQYKTDSILGLAMCEELEKLQAALQLGSTHGVEAWEIMLSHVRSLLLSNSLSLSERLTDNRLTQPLRDQAEAVGRRLQESVLPAMSGANYNQLISYYTVLQTVAPNTAVNGLLPRDHIKLIKKVKATSPDIDYVRLVTKPSEVMGALKPVVRKDTIASVAKLVKELLKALPQLQAHISVGSLYTEWAVMQFKTECLSPTCRQPLEQFGALQIYLQKMGGADLLSFVKRAIFCHQSVLKLDVDTREAMLDLVLNCGRQQHLSNGNPDFLKIQELKDYLLQVWYLEKYSSKNLKSYLLRLDEACGDPDAISTIIQTALLDASVPSFVLHKMAKLSNKRGLSSYITDLLHSLPSQPSLISIILQRVEDCLTNGEKGETWSILVGPLTERTELPANVRRQAAQISQRLGDNYTEELEALRLRTEAVLRTPVTLSQVRTTDIHVALQRLGDNYTEELEALRLRTEAVLRTPVTLSQVRDQNSRYLLFKQLLTESDTWDNLQQLSLLLTTWPDVDTSWYLELIECMAEVSYGEKFLTLQRIFKKNAFEEEEVLHLVSRLEGGTDELFTISVCLIPEFKRLHLKGVHLLKGLQSEAPLSKELVRRIVETDLTAELVEASIFPRLKEVLLESCQDLCERVANQLTAANHINEANVFQQASTRLS